MSDGKAYAFIREVHGSDLEQGTDCPHLCLPWIHKVVPDEYLEISYDHFRSSSTYTIIISSHSTLHKFANDTALLESVLSNRILLKCFDYIYI
jgi:hypothetical protein